MRISRLALGPWSGATQKSGFTLVASLAAAGFTSAALAQDPPPVAPPPAPPPAAAPAEQPAAPAAAAEPPAAAEGAEVPAAAAEAAAPGAAAEAPAAAPEEGAAPPAPAISGYVEAAYHRSLTNPAVNTPLFTRAYDYNGSNSFTLHNAHLAVKHAFTDNVSAVIELDGGYDAYANNLVANAGSSVPMGGFIDVQEAYATASTSGFSFTAGRFVTYQGIEVVEGPLDPTITRGFLYTWAEPISHAGFKAHYATGPIDMGLGLVNGWDKILADNNNWKTLIWRAGVSVEMFWAGFSGTYGAEGVTDDNKRLSLDLTGAVTPIEMLAINFQANYGSEPNAGYGDDPMGVPTLGLDDATWLGFGVQPVLTVDAFSLGARVEWFNDTNGARLLVDDTSYVNFTITPGYTFDEAFTVRAEYRMDTASNDVFVKDAYDSRDPTTGEPIPELTGSQSTIAVGVDYQF